MIKKYAIATCFLVQAVAIFGSQNGSSIEKGKNPLGSSQEIPLNRSAGSLRKSPRGNNAAGTTNGCHSWHWDSGKPDPQEPIRSIRRDFLPTYDCP